MIYALCNLLFSRGDLPFKPVDHLELFAGDMAITKGEWKDEQFCVCYKLISFEGAKLRHANAAGAKAQLHPHGHSLRPEPRHHERRGLCERLVPNAFVAPSDWWAVGSSGLLNMGVYAP